METRKTTFKEVKKDFWLANEYSSFIMKCYLFSIFVIGFHNKKVLLPVTPSQRRQCKARAFFFFLLCFLTSKVSRKIVLVIKCFCNLVFFAEIKKDYYHCLALILKSEKIILFGATFKNE